MTDGIAGTNGIQNRSMREQIARVIAHECFGAESTWRHRLNAADRVLDVLMEMPAPPGEPLFESTGLIFRAWIRAAKSGA